MYSVYFALNFRIIKLWHQNMVILSFICIIVHIFFLPRGPNLLAFFLDIDLDIVSSAESYWELFVHLLFPFKIKKLISKLKILNLFAISLVEKF